MYGSYVRAHGPQSVELALFGAWGVEASHDPPHLYYNCAMRTYTFTTTISPMDDDDLAHNFLKMRRRYWINKGLYIPADVIVRFEKISRTKLDRGKPPFLGESYPGLIRISPILKHVWVQVHTTLLHEMAHLYVGELTKWDGRYYGHGKMFNKEIDRLYALGAFRGLI